MTENITYDYLWEAYQKEKQTNQLLLVPKNFYSDAMKYIAKLKQNERQNQHIIENSTMLVDQFFEKRKQKILMYAAYGKQLPQPISNDETEFYNGILQLMKSRKLDFSKAFTSSGGMLKALKEIPEIMLPSGRSIGPFKKDQMVEVQDSQDSEYLKENSICESVTE